MICGAAVLMALGGAGFGVPTALGHGDGGGRFQQQNAQVQRTGPSPGKGHDPGHGKGKGKGNGPPQAAAPQPPAQGNGHGRGNDNAKSTAKGNAKSNGHAHGAAAGPTAAPAPPVTESTFTTATPSTPAPAATPAPAPATATPSVSTGLTLSPAKQSHAAAGSRRRARGVGSAARGLGFSSGGLTPLAVTGALAPGTAAIGARSALGAGKTVHTRERRLPARALPTLGTPAARVIEHFISVIPTGVWIALAAALGLAAIGGGSALRSTRRARHQEGRVAAVTAAALTDPLTGVLNRRGFTDAAERELNRARRYEHPLALAFVDVRGLKAVNDSEGHLAGDELIKEVAILLRESARVHDVVGRIGGDELAVLLAEQSTRGAAAMSERVRAQVPTHRAAVGLDTLWDVTIGTATFPDDAETLDGLLAVADRRLYEQRGIELRTAGAASRLPARS
jgi:diguanylate cyclase (GGDEF)-like protein